MKTIDQLAKEFSECFPVIGEKNATLKGCLYDAWQAGRKEAVQFALEANRITVKLLEKNKIKTPYVIGAINALTESSRDLEDILKGDMTPAWPSEGH